MKKNTRLKFIYKGKFIRMHILYKGNLFNKIPIYVSRDIEGMQAIKLSNGNIFIVENPEYTNIMTELDYKAEVLHKVFDLKYNNSYISDYCTSKLIGYTPVVKNITDKDRLTRLEALMRSNGMRIRTLDELLEDIAFEEVV